MHIYTSPNEPNLKNSRSKIPAETWAIFCLGSSSLPQIVPKNTKIQYSLDIFNSDVSIIFDNIMEKTSRILQQEPVGILIVI